MQQLQQFRFYELGARLYGIFNVRTHQRIADLFGPLTEAQKALDALIKGDPITLKSAKPEATRLLTQISSLFDKYFIDQVSRQLRFPAPEEKMDTQELALVELALQKFDSALAAELGRHIVFLTPQCGIYNVADLIDNAHRAVPEHLLQAVPEAACRELDAAGRALGFDLGTAATMHALRALELMTAAYYELYAAPLTNRNERNLATYIRKLAALADDDSVKKRPDQRRIDLLSQIKDSYRNPLMSSDVAVETGSAAALFGLVVSAITQLAEPVAAQQSKPEFAAKSDPQKAPATVISPIKGDEIDEDEVLIGSSIEGEQDEEDVYDFRVSQAV